MQSAVDMEMLEERRSQCFDQTERDQTIQDIQATYREEICAHGVPLIEELLQILQLSLTEESDSRPWNSLRAVLLQGNGRL